MYDLRHFIHTVEATVDAHNLGLPGAYRRWTRSSARDMGINPYGCADAANILYTTGRFPGDVQERQAWIGTLQGLQNAESGMFTEPTHHPIHTTAHCIAALELFDARPRYPLNDLRNYLRTHELSAFLDTLDWRGNPWNESHRGAGLYAALVLTGSVNLEWEERYFTWLWEESDAQTGMIGKDRIHPISIAGKTTLFPYLAGTFHYLFNLEYSHRPLRFPWKLVDTCLDLLYSGEFPLGERISFAEIDWVYCLNRAVRQCGYRFSETRQALQQFAARYIPFLLDVDPDQDADFDDLHLLFGALCCLAELQQALPGQIRTQHPLRLVLDRRPFI
jgi:hypothetical protein